ncbi:Dynein light chain 1, cytoplasmic [Labeo rohita]|uniref:Dynein light chain n=1 Tax=Labeo rohita TaxID=84645 RepID=A0ABQ8MGG5_LABRO|nr:Dynein light chain 1, cytoplasmic [Labeo rohita]
MQAYSAARLLQSRPIAESGMAATANETREREEPTAVTHLHYFWSSTQREHHRRCERVSFLSVSRNRHINKGRNREKHWIGSTMSDRKAVIKNADMSEEMQQDAVECATQALEKYNIEKDIAAYIKKEFDKKYNPTWHCIVGRNFGSYVTHETKHFIYFYLGQVAILLFKSG